MRLRTGVVLLVVVGLVVVIAAVMMGNSAGPNARLADNTDAGSGASQGGVENGQASRSPGAAAPSPDQSGKSDNDKSGSPSGKEGNPSAGTHALPYALPDSKASAKPKPLVSAPLPATASARGSMVTGFPGVISKAPKSTVAFSSVTTQGTRMQVGLDATSSISPADVLTYYRTAFTRLGLVAASTPAVDGSTALSFVRGRNGITVTVSAAAGGPRSHYTVTGTFTAGT